MVSPKTLAFLAYLISPDNIDSKTYGELKTTLEGQFSPKHFVVFERFNFCSRVQRPYESASVFVIALKHLPSSQKFSTFLKDALGDKLIFGIHNEDIWFSQCKVGEFRQIFFLLKYSLKVKRLSFLNKTGCLSKNQKRP